MKTKFSTAIFNLHWMYLKAGLKVETVMEIFKQHDIEDKQMGGKQMSLANIIDSNIINPFKVDDGAKVNEEN